MAEDGGTCVVLGGGVTGLATAWKLAEAGRKVELLELADEVGGASRTFKWKDFLVDTGPHKVSTQLEGILESVADLLGDELVEIPKQTSICMQGRLLDYPFRLIQLLTGLSPLFGVRLGLSYLLSVVTERGRKEVSYEDWIVKRFGWALYRATFEGLAQKIWSDPKQLAADLARRRIVTPGMMVLLKRILFGRSDKQAPKAAFHYPRMGIGRINDKMVERIERHGGKVSVGQRVTKISHEGGRVTNVTVESSAGSREIVVDRFISTIPIPRLFDLLSPAPPESVRAAAGRLRMTPVMLGFISFKAERLLRDVWIFFPEKKYLFNRICEQKGFSLAMGPADKTVLCFDVTAGHMPEAWEWSDEKILSRCLEDLRDCGLYHGEEVLDRELFKLKEVYPIYDLDYRKNLNECLDQFDTIDNLYTTGRAGLFCYNNIDQCLDMSFRLVRHILADGTKDELRKLLEYFDAYEIVD